MIDIEIILTETLREDYRLLPKTVKKKFDKQLRFLAQNPRHPSLKIPRIKDHWEFYVDRKYRCIFQKKKNLFILKHVGSHKIVDDF